MNSKHIIHIALVFLLISCASNKYGETPINQFQVIGSHNSYKQAIDKHLLDTLKVLYPWANELEYSHISLPDQLSLGLRNLEIDIYADTQGGRFAHPKGFSMIPGQSPYNADGVMNRPGFKIFHVTEIDFRSSCPTLKICLQQLKKWSDSHPNHFPVFITLEAKENSQKEVEEGRSSPTENFTPKLFAELDSIILAELGKEKVITPDFVRGNSETLNKAITQQGWPKLNQVKGKFLFILDDNGSKCELYLKDHPSLKGRVLFVNAKPGDPASATLILNNPKEDLSISDLAKHGYLIRTRSDANTIQARNNDYSQFDAACQSGAQIITTDYYKVSDFFKSSYRIAFKDNTYVRKNPLFEKK
jgi:hypothetical protein